MLSQLKVEIQELKKIQAEKYSKTEDFYDLTYSVFEKCLRTKSVEKHRVLSKIYVDLINKEIDFESALDTLFLDYVIELKPIQFRLLILISEIENELFEIESFANFYELLIQKHGFKEIDKDEFKLHVNKLESLTLISTGASLVNFDDVSSISEYEDHHPASVIVTSLGSKFLKYINEIDV